MSKITGQEWIIVFPKGDKTKLSMSLAWDYEFDEYARASRLSWPYDQESEAREYGRDLAEKHGLEVTGGLKPDDDYLD